MVMDFHLCSLIFVKTARHFLDSSISILKTAFSQELFFFKRTESANLKMIIICQKCKYPLQALIILPYHFIREKSIMTVSNNYIHY